MKKSIYSVIASGTKQSQNLSHNIKDCFGQKVLAMTTVVALSLVVGACKNSGKKLEENKETVETFLNNYNKKYQELSTIANEAQWKSQTHIVQGDTVSARETEKAMQALADFTGSSENIEKIKKYLSQKDSLTPLQKEQLEHVLYFAGSNPQTVADVVKEKIKEETAATDKLYGFDYKLDGKSVTTNEIDNILKHEQNLDKRLKAWECSKEVGKGLKDELVKLRELRNKTVQGLNYADFITEYHTCLLDS